MKQNARVSPGLIVLIVLVLLLINLSALAWIGWPALQERGLLLPTNISSDVSDQTAVGQPAPSHTPSAVASATASPPALDPGPTKPPILTNMGDPMDGVREQGVLLISLRDGNTAHLFAYHPGLLPLTRLTDTQWDEIDPAVSPDGKRLAYTSRQNGYWDLYIRDLVNGTVDRITDNPGYEGRPSWSPDGQWLVYAGNNAGTLDLYLLSLTDRSQAPIHLTDDANVETSPAWSPQGRKIAFVSTRSGYPQVWLADLDRTDEKRFEKISSEPLAFDAYPMWSPDGRYLAWSSQQNGEHRLVVWDSQKPEVKAGWSGYGDRPIWSPDGRMLITTVKSPNQDGLEIYDVGTANERIPMLQLPGESYGLVWVPGPLEGWLAEVVQRGDTRPSAALIQPVLTLAPNPPGDRTGMIDLTDVSAPFSMLSDAVDEAFQTLRLKAAVDTGWDILSSLENAYLPLTSPASPSLQEEWLYTGRAFSLNPLILSAGWMAVIREDFGGQTYWRLFLKARFQDGSAGIPLDTPVWDLNARFTGDTTAYEQGGQPGIVPEGYWIDLTELSRRYGWERLASKPNWRTFFPAIRFNQFVFRAGLDWNQAMAEVYPPEALASPTSIPSPTITLTPTRAPTRYRTTQTPSPTPTYTPTRRPTFTKQP